MMTTRQLLPLLLLCPSFAQAEDIAWRGDLRSAKKDASTSSGVVFIAVNMDGERANDRMVKEVYRNKTIRGLAAKTINLVASNDTHASGDKTCPRFGTVTCEQHRHVDADVRGQILAPDEGGYVVAPQHVFLGPNGEVILSVPYEVKAEELEWCFVTALRAVNPDLRLELSSKARAPRRLVMGGVYSLGTQGTQIPLTREAALELIKELKKGLLRGGELVKGLLRLSMADEPEARDYILGVLRTAPGRGGGGRGGGGGGGGWGGGGRELHAAFLHQIGANSPVSYWEVCIEFIDHNDPLMRAEAIVAIEQLGTRDSLKALINRLRKEKEDVYAKNLLRAIGTSGHDDKNARKVLLKQAGSDRAPLRQVNAVLALGWLANHKDIAALLRDAIDSEDPDVQKAAVLAMAISRDKDWNEVLTGKLEGEADGPFKDTLVLALDVLKSGTISELRDTVKLVATDELDRERIFGASPRSNEERTRPPEDSD